MFITRYLMPYVILILKFKYWTFLKIYAIILLKKRKGSTKECQRGIHLIRKSFSEPYLLLY